MNRIEHLLRETQCSRVQKAVIHRDNDEGHHNDVESVLDELMVSS